MYWLDLVWWEWIVLGLVAGAEFALSWLNHRINWFNISQQRWKATRYDLVANTLAELIPFFIYVYSQKPIFILPRIFGNTVGTFYASGKKPPRPIRKKKSTNKYPKTITTA
jgi:hypothetical protein